MALNKSKLLEYLDNQSIIADEKRMWYRIGMYIEPHPTKTYTNSLGTITLKKTLLIDSMGNETELSEIVARNLRMTILEWWEGEKLKPRASEKNRQVPTSPWDELEVERG